MITGLGVSSYDLSSMEKYGSQAVTNKREDYVLSTKSEVVGLQSMFRAHRQEMALSH
jgi:hypothetical protein